MIKATTVQKRIAQATSLLVPLLSFLGDAQIASAQQTQQPAAPAQTAEPSINWVPGLIIGVIIGGVFAFIQAKKKKDSEK